MVVPLRVLRSFRSFRASASGVGRFQSADVCFFLFFYSLADVERFSPAGAFTKPRKSPKP